MIDYMDTLSNGKYTKKIKILGNAEVSMINFTPRECPSGYTPEYNISDSLDICSITYRIKVPMAISNQMLKYGITNFKFVNKNLENWDITQSPRFKNIGEVKGVIEKIEEHQKEIYTLYKQMLKFGCDSDISSFVLPMSEFIIMYATFKLSDLLIFLTLYDNDDIQIETREVVRVMHQLAQPIFPNVFKKYITNRLKNENECKNKTNKTNNMAEYTPPKNMKKYESGFYDYIMDNTDNPLFKVMFVVFLMIIVRIL